MAEFTLTSTGIPDLLPMTGRTGDPLDHVSVIIRDLCLRLGHYEERSAEEASPLTLWQLGSAFEDAVALALAERWAKQYPGRYARPGELELASLVPGRPIKGTPDLLDLIDEKIVEIKLTWLSSRHDAESDKYWKYWQQGKTYAKMIGWTKVQLHVAHINGSYDRNRKGPDPHYNIWDGEFTQPEIDQTWRMITTHHRKLVLSA